MKNANVFRVLALALIGMALCASSASAQSSHSVTLTWTASTSLNVTYNVYRGTVSGGPYSKLNTAPITVLTYVDSANIVTTYYYVCTAVNSSGIESVNSNEVSGGVPNPPTALGAVTH